MALPFTDFRAELADRLRRARGELSQAELAEIAHHTQQMISRYENGRAPKSFEGRA